jgi:hypothetical protein
MNTASDIEISAFCDAILSAESPAGLANPRAFMLAGKATFTVVSGKTGTRFTYKVVAKTMNDGKVLHFVSVLTGSDNTSDYTFLGTIFDRASYRHGNRSPIGREAASAKAFAWTWERLTAGNLTGATIHHEGRCGRCNRALTVPESILSGFGPECAGKMGA